ncbi:hypothetical protein C8R44DRAFT_987154 [Mycena epipterygia]|nr:hypothetical protein C8R44DRAFT_987154 [Mycena epipterygia]
MATPFIRYCLSGPWISLTPSTNIQARHRRINTQGHPPEAQTSHLNSADSIPCATPMCWPRPICCRCPGPSALPWPPSLRFGRFPRRPALPAAAWNPWPYIPQDNSPPPPIIPLIPSRRPLKNRDVRVRFEDDDDDARPGLVDFPLAPCPPMVPSPPAWPQFNLSPELCSPRGSYPYLDWDITQFPSSAQRCTSRYSRSAAPLDASATFPPTHFLSLSYADNPVLLHCERMWGPIFVRGEGLHSITIERVLNAIYQYFNQPLSAADRATMSSHAWGLVSDAYYQRLPRSPNMQAFDASRGALRLDVLNGATKFAGLQCVGRDYFRLMLAA